MEENRQVSHIEEFQIIYVDGLHSRSVTPHSLQRVQYGKGGKEKLYSRTPVQLYLSQVVQANSNSDECAVSIYP